MRSSDIVVGRGGHKIISSGTAYDSDDYHFYGFVPHEDTTFTTLKMGTIDLSDDVSGITYKAGIYYPMRAKYGTDVELATGSCVLYLTLNSPKSY